MKSRGGKEARKKEGERKAGEGERDGELSFPSYDPLPPFLPSLPSLLGRDDDELTCRLRVRLRRRDEKVWTGGEEGRLLKRREGKREGRGVRASTEGMKDCSRAGRRRGRFSVSVRKGARGGESWLLTLERRDRRADGRCESKGRGRVSRIDQTQERARGLALPLRDRDGFSSSCSFSHTGSDRVEAKLRHRHQQKRRAT